MKNKKTVISIAFFAVAGAVAVPAAYFLPE